MRLIGSIRFGGEGWLRPSGLLGFNEALYQLSYFPKRKDEEGFETESAELPLTSNSQPLAVRVTLKLPSPGLSQKKDPCPVPFPSVLNNTPNMILIRSSTNQ